MFSQINYNNTCIPDKKYILWEVGDGERVIVQTAALRSLKSNKE